MLNAFVAIAFTIILEIIFLGLIFPPHDHLGSFGIIHEGVVWWLQRAWEGLRVCWDLIWFLLHEFGRLVLRISEELARVLGASRLLPMLWTQRQRLKMKAIEVVNRVYRRLTLLLRLIMW